MDHDEFMMYAYIFQIGGDDGGGGGEILVHSIVNRWTDGLIMI